MTRRKTRIVSQNGMKLNAQNVRMKMKMRRKRKRRKKRKKKK